MKHIRNFVVAHLWWVVLIVAAALLVAHTLGVTRFVVDNTSLILLVLVLLSPFVAAIKKIKIGEFEAEIEPEEVKRVAKQAEESLPDSPSGEMLSPEINRTGAAIRSLADTDPRVALAKLRIELETRIRRLHKRTGSDISQQQKRPVPLAYAIKDLANAEILTPQLGSSLREVIDICNRAIHGEDIREVDAKRIVDAGIDLLAVLQSEIQDYAATHPVETTQIEASERDALQNGKYRLTTIVPLVDNPERRVYVLTQDELDEFFDGYSEFGEFVGALERID